MAIARVALIDGDAITWKCSAVCENASNPGLANYQADQYIARILEDVNADNWIIYLSGENNFRYGIFPEYKANRRDKPRPKYLESVREYLVTDHGARITDGYEADDALGIATTEWANDNYVICSGDKDLQQLKGEHYHLDRRELTRVTEFGGLRNFYEQLLVGDPTDNIRGCPGIGKVKAPKLLDGCHDESCLAECTWEAFSKAGATELEFIRDGRLLWILRSANARNWRPPLTFEL